MGPKNHRVTPIMPPFFYSVVSAFWGGMECAVGMGAAGDVEGDRKETPIKQ